MFRTDQFIYCKESKTLITEASALGILPGFAPAREFGLESSKTGQRMTCVADCRNPVDRDAEGEILGWNFVPLGFSTKLRKIVIIND